MLDFGHVNKTSLLTFAGLLTVSAAFAVPSYDTFGSLPAATFGGTGIPNDAVAIKTITDGSVSVTLGLTAHQRYDNPALANNGAGVFTAQPGANVKGGTLGALWNFAFYVNVTGTLASPWSFDVLYDFNPGANTPESSLGAIHLGNTLGADDSQNLLFAYLDGSTAIGGLAATLGFTTPPTGSFNPNADGEYSFALIARDVTGAEVGRSAITVNVGSGASVPDAGSTAGLALLSLGGLIVFGYAQRRLQVA